MPKYKGKRKQKLTYQGLVKAHLEVDNSDSIYTIVITTPTLQIIRLQLRPQDVKCLYQELFKRQENLLR
jgi:hypothetical protein